jgi:hypothetical protein
MMTWGVTSRRQLLISELLLAFYGLDERIRSRELPANHQQNSSTTLSDADNIKTYDMLTAVILRAEARRIVLIIRSNSMRVSLTGGDVPENLFKVQQLQYESITDLE